MKRWTEYLREDVFIRLCNCRSLKADIKYLVNARWLWTKETGKDKEGVTKEDALVYVLEHLESNSQVFDLTEDEYRQLCTE